MYNNLNIIIGFCALHPPRGNSKEEIKMSKISTKNLVLAAILTALVVILQLMGSFIKLGPFSISLVLIPIVIGAATCGAGVSTWLGFVFGIAVLISGDAAAFLAVNVPATILTVLVKGTAAGLCAGLVYKLFAKKNLYVAVVAAAIICPIVNTGIFLIGCLLFFMDAIVAMAMNLGFGADVSHFMIFGLVGGNFLVELGTNIILSPIVVRLLNIRSKQ